MSRLRSLFLILIVGMIAGCSKPVINTSTDASTASSIQHVRASLSRSDQLKFDDALSAIIGRHQSISAIISGESERSMEREALQSVNGKDGEQIIAIGKRIKAMHERELK